MSGLNARFLCFLVLASALLAQSERPLRWRDELAVLRSNSQDPGRVAAIRADAVNWFNLHPSVEILLQPAPPLPWNAEQTSAQIAELIDAVTGILKIEEAFDLGVTTVNVTAAVSPLSPVSDGIDQAELSARNALNVTQAIPYLPGVSVDHKSARNQNGISIRGFDTRQAPVYLDGVPMYVPFDGYVDLSRFLTNDIAEIQVARGYFVTVQVPVSIFLDKSPRIVYRMVDECESVSPENAEASLGESSSALEPAQP